MYAPANVSKVLTLASDAVTAANTTPVNLTGMSFDYESGGVYVWEMYMFVTPAAATTGCGFQLNTSTSPTVNELGMSFFHQLATTGTLSGGSSQADDTSLGVSSGMPGTSTYFVRGSGILIASAGGNGVFRFRSETTAVTTCKAGSIITVNRIK